MQWAPRRHARDQRRPAGFVEPCHPILARAAPEGSDWCHEVKHDGWRLIAHKDAGRVRLWSRTANDLTAQFPAIAEAVGALTPAVLTLDGEAVVFRPDGHSAFSALRSRRAARAAQMIAFDLLEMDGDLRGEPLHERQRQLERLLKGAPAALKRSETIIGRGPEVFVQACALGLEGIVSKRLDARYRSGRALTWLKIKNPAFVRR
ncbi:MAG TPA: DNA ligase [Beijerinckiaceae bacterium]|nr:DNA ligase [Beijerinckiaceae bacterium]